MNVRSALARSPGAAGPLAGGEYSWRDDAACASVDPELFFPEHGCDVEEIRQAKAVCRRCPVREPCLEYALERGEHRGIWGGTSERERRRIKRQQALADLGEAA